MRGKLARANIGLFGIFVGTTQFYRPLFSFLYGNISNQSSCSLNRKICMTHISYNALSHANDSYTIHTTYLNTYPPPLPIEHSPFSLLTPSRVPQSLQQKPNTTSLTHHHPTTTHQNSAVRRNSNSAADLCTLNSRTEHPSSRQRWRRQGRAMCC